MEKIIEAWNNGAIIECKSKNSNYWVRLFTKEEYPKITWHPYKYDYRIAQ